ncbi:hypothetical protein FNJ87_10900 [Nonlabens mediterrranea]|uniref:Phosphoserine phosphatase n=1 Tax=Nonlabens mediterrranea TaxID=1419947 RepID=A0ABS0A626_9FLAO|nr:hypothetical protein [Nonlabens mediterrranea]
MENEARESISSRVARVRKEQDQINSEQGGEITKYRNLEERYLRKKSQLEWEQSEVEQEQVNYDAAIEEERDYIKEHLTEREVRKDIDRQEKELDKEFRELEERERELIKELRERIGNPRSTAITRFREGIERRENSILNYSKRRTKVAERRKAMANEKEGYDSARESRYEEYRKQVLERIDKEDISGDDELSNRIRTVLQVRRLSRDFEARRNLEQKLRNIEK